MIFEGIEHKKERLYIHWDITTKCNYKCNYCYAIENYSKENNWNKEETYSNIKAILKSIEISKLPVFLGLLGGEPTLSKWYFEILEYINKKIIPKHKDNRLYITTNLSKPLSYWEKHPKYEKTFILASFHPEYNTTDSSIELFINKLLYLKDFFKVKVNIMLDPKYDFVTEIFIQKIKKYSLNKYINIHPHIIYPDGSPHKELTKIYKNSFDKYSEIYSFMENEYILTDDKNLTTELKDIDIFSKKLNNFNGWNCYQNNYEINYPALVTNTCFYDNVDLRKNITFFKKITKIKPRICPHKACNCDGLLKIRKEKNNEHTTRKKD